MHSLKFLLDADMPKSSAQVIRDLGFEIEDVRDIGMRAVKDREIMDYAFKNNKIIITMDLDFGEVLRYPQHPGAIILRLPYAFTSKEINERIREFSEENSYRYQACFNGRSSGYIVLIQGGKEPSGYQSFCTNCGQLNYKKVLPLAETPEDKVRNYVRVKNWWTPGEYIQQEEVTKHGLTTERVLEIVKEVRAEKTEYSGDAACGKCGAVARKNFATSHQRVYTKGIGTDEDADFENEGEWDLGSIKDRYDLVMSFDKMVDDCIEAFKSVCDNYRVVEIKVPCTRIVKVLEPLAAEA